MNSNPEYPKDMKKTIPRLTIFKILSETEIPLSASEIYKKAQEHDLKINFSTIYRTLKAFEDQGIIQAHSLPSNEEAVYELKREDHRHYAICIKCRKKIALSNCPISCHIEELEENNFEVTSHHVEIFGYCQNCRNNLD